MGRERELGELLWFGDGLVELEVVVHLGWVCVDLGVVVQRRVGVGRIWIEDVAVLVGCNGSGKPHLDLVLMALLEVLLLHLHLQLDLLLFFDGAPDKVSEIFHLVHDQLFHHVHVVGFFERLEVELDLAPGLVLGIVPHQQVGVFQRFLHRDSLERVQRQHFFQEVESQRVGVGENFAVGHLAHGRERPHVVLGSHRPDFREGGFVRSAENQQDLVELVDIVLAAEERFSPEKLGQDASCRPDVNGLGVVGEREHDLRRPVPSGGHVLGHKSSVLLGVFQKPAGQPEVADLELAVGVDEQVARLQVAVEHVGRVDVLEPTQHLVDEGLVVRVGQRLARPDDLVHVALHELLVEVYFVEVAGERVGHDVQVVETGDVLVAPEELEEFELAQRSLAQDFFGKNVGDFLDGHEVAVVGPRPVVVLGGAHDPVRAVAELLDDLEPLIDDELLPEHSVDGFPCHRTHGDMSRRKPGNHAS